MKPGLAGKLALLLASVGALTSGLTGLYAYQTSRQTLVESAQNTLLTSTQVLARRITLSRQEITRNLEVLARHPAALSTLQQADAAQSHELAMLFSLLMSANPSYFQIRLISASNHGIERVRVDRQDDKPIEVTGDDLQEKGHYPYVAETLKLRAGEFYLSEITVNHERGSYAGMDQPALQLATPVADGRGVAIGVVVVNVDLNGMFALLAADLPANFKLFLANDNGDILIHPDPSRTFGFDKGRRVLIADEFPPTRDIVEGRRGHVVFESIESAGGNGPLVAAFMGQAVDVPSHERRLILGLGQPLSEVVAQAHQFGTAILQIVLGLCVGCLLLAAILARAFTRPINALNSAAQGFASGQPSGPLPVERRDEIGALARSFQQMQNQITKQLEGLQNNQQELERLAQHDMLTGLPNRRLLVSRLEKAMAHARRYGGEVSVLFIDLDDFKSINDRCGHDTGDLVLKAVAQRLLSSMREGDTVARIGGDEFVALLGAPTPHAQLVTVAEKLLGGIRAPIDIEGVELTVGASIGISRYPQDGQTASELLATADNAMYTVKATGLGGFAFSSKPAD
ncbi:MAG: diguanylate cyclase [Burkholderiaceae bacterium]|nr:diguanylate cyclase [Burkholderiaceae bacterium]